MMLYSCTKCRMPRFEKRKVCPSCRGESFIEIESDDPKRVATSQLNVTPMGFDESYYLVLGITGGAMVLFQSMESREESGNGKEGGT